ncbi:S8 family serine peptidase, partial [Nocardioides sp.]|uniref:S8 family serine peptidase n=1 Tax=Nocardioides sp. TaxID=35761 RepID=UPI002737263B
LAIERSPERLTARRPPGAGVTVAVVDSGVAPGNGRIEVSRAVNLVGGGPLVSGHGTIVAGLIAGAPRPDGGGLVGVAPGAAIVSVRVLDSQQPRDGETGVTSGNVARGLDWVADNARAEGITVANVSLAVPDSRELRRAVERVQAAGVVVVAATGDRPTGEVDPLHAAFPGGFVSSEDAAELVHPAGYRGVVAVNAVAPTGQDPYATVLRSGRTDVAAPSDGAVSVGPNASTCVVDRTSTEYAAAVVSGVVALLRAEYPEDTPEQTVARLTTTADGSPTVRTPATGAGMVQPLEALTRDLRPDPRGRVTLSDPISSEEPRAVPPPPPEDLYAASRDRFVWWGLVAGGVLLLAIVLRPLLARR